MYLTKPIESDWYSWHNISLKLFILSFTVVVLLCHAKFGLCTLQCDLVSEDGRLFIFYLALIKYTYLASQGVLSKEYWHNSQPH